MFGFVRKTRAWDPSLERFPEINIDAISRELNLSRRGKDDGEKEQPPSEAALLTTTEQSAVDAIGKLRREALSSYELELQALRQRVASAKSESSEIRLKIGDAITSLERMERKEELLLEPARREVAAYQTKVAHFLNLHGAVAPPRPMASGFFTIAFILFMLAIESTMNGLFFAERNEMGLVGGVTQAFVISLINVSIGFGGGFFLRYVNFRGVLYKTIGILSFVIWLTVAIPFNLAVAHFRNALEAASLWEEALKQSISLTVSAPFDLDSLSSWTLFLIGMIITFASLLKGVWIGDPIPGFNSIWDQSERAMNRYAEAFTDAHTELEEAFREEREALQSEVERRRADLRSATDALLSRKTMSSGLDIFLESADSAATMLLKHYREANQKARKTPAPRYFNEVHRFERPQFADLEEIGFGREVVESEIVKMEHLVEVGVAHLMQAQKRSLLAFPTIDDIRSGKTERKAVEGENPLKVMSETIDHLLHPASPHVAPLAGSQAHGEEPCSGEGAVEKLKKPRQPRKPKSEAVNQLKDQVE